MFAIVKDRTGHHFVVTGGGSSGEKDAMKEHIERTSRTPDYGRGLDVVAFASDHDAAEKRANELNAVAPVAPPVTAIAPARKTGKQAESEKSE